MRYFSFLTTNYNSFEFCIGAHTRIEAFAKAKECFEHVKYLGVSTPITIKKEHIDIVQIPYKDKKLYPEHIEVRI